MSNTTLPPPYWPPNLDRDLLVPILLANGISFILLGSLITRVRPFLCLGLDPIPLGELGSKCREEGRKRSVVASRLPRPPLYLPSCRGEISRQADRKLLLLLLFTSSIQTDLLLPSSLHERLGLHQGGRLGSAFRQCLPRCCPARSRYSCLRARVRRLARLGRLPVQSVSPHRFTFFDFLSSKIASS